MNDVLEFARAFILSGLIVSIIVVCVLVLELTCRGASRLFRLFTRRSNNKGSNHDN